MKIKLFFPLIIIAFTALILQFTNCKKEKEKESEVNVTGVTLNVNEYKLGVYGTLQLTATVQPKEAANKVVTYKSSNQAVATVTNAGLVTGILLGTAIITVTTKDGNKTDQCNLTIVSVNPPEMIFVEGGTFTMGCVSEDTICFYNEKPSHQVTLSSFHIGKYEVTQSLWMQFMGNNPSIYKGNTNPVERVSWNDIVGTAGNYITVKGINYYENGFIYKLSKHTGKQYRLPTEAEWEFAACGGNKSKGYIYCGSNSVFEVAWYIGNCKTKEYPNGKTYSVGSLLPNELGIYDMSGNVWELCSDWYGEYSVGAEENPVGPSTGLSRVIRGGSWSNDATFTRVTSRATGGPDVRDYRIGFRLAMCLE